MRRGTNWYQTQLGAKPKPRATVWQTSSTRSTDLSTAKTNQAQIFSCHFGLLARIELKFFVRTHGIHYHHLNLVSMAAGSAKRIHDGKYAFCRLRKKIELKFAVSSRISQQPVVASLRRLFLSPAESFLLQIHVSIVRIDQVLSELR